MSIWSRTISSPRNRWPRCARPTRPAHQQNLISVAIRERRVVHEPDVLISGGYSELQRTSGYRSILVVPMLRDEVAIGAIAVMRLEPQLFPKAQVELLKTFAGQAVIAIENTRLFTELQERSRQLSQSLEELRAAQGSLVQTEKLAALGRLVAGVAHEINTPVGTSLTRGLALINKTKRFEADIAKGDVRRSTLSEFIAASREAAFANHDQSRQRGRTDPVVQAGSQPIATFGSPTLRSRRGDRAGCQRIAVRTARAKPDGDRRPARPILP
jgi:signal transduction histidine kinase